jgi:hypothetical protein
MNHFMLATLFVIISSVSLAGGAWLADAAAVNESRIAATNLFEDVQSSNFSVLSNLH